MNKKLLTIIISSVVLFGGSPATYAKVKADEWKQTMFSKAEKSK